MNRTITYRTLREIKKLAKKRLKADASKSHCQHLEDVAREVAGVGCYHEAKVLADKNTAPPERVDPLEGLTSEQREQYYYRMMSILDREILEIYPESNQYLSDSDFDHDDY